MHFLIIDIRKRVGDVDTPHYAVARIIEELKRRAIPYETCHYDDLSLSVHNKNFSITAKGKDLTEFSHIIIRGHRTDYEYMLKQHIVTCARKNGIIVQNANFIARAPHYTKTIQMQMLSDAGIPFIDSYYTIDGRYWEKKEIVEELGFPLIYKHTEGEYRLEIIDGVEKTKKNIYLVNNIEELAKECKLRDEPEDSFLTKASKFFIQRFVDTGADYRAMVIGGSYKGGWKRVATRNFLTVSKGEYTLLTHPDAAFQECAEKTAAVFEADYCAVDIIYVENTPYVLEINMNPGFKAFEQKVAGNTLNVAKEIVDAMLEQET